MWIITIIISNVCCFFWYALLIILLLGWNYLCVMRAHIYIITGNIACKKRSGMHVVILSITKMWLQKLETRSIQILFLRVLSNLGVWETNYIAYSYLHVADIFLFYYILALVGSGRQHMWHSLLDFSVFAKLAERKPKNPTTSATNVLSLPTNARFSIFFSYFISICNSILCMTCTK